MIPIERAYLQGPRKFDANGIISGLFLSAHCQGARDRDLAFNYGGAQSLRHNCCTNSTVYELEVKAGGCIQLQ